MKPNIRSSITVGLLAAIAATAVGMAMLRARAADLAMRKAQAAAMAAEERVRQAEAGQLDKR